jgi:hypothetical protein
MSIPETNNKLQFPPTLIDFDNVVGLTGQLHDNIPDAGQQPRFDWYRMWLIALLANQSSTTAAGPPNQYRTGTLWYNRDEQAFFVAYQVTNNPYADFIPLANAIKLNASDSYTLQQFYNDTIGALSSLLKKFTFSGTTTSITTTSIPIPSYITTAISPNIANYSPVVYINGLLVDPRNCQFNIGCPTTVNLLNGIILNRGDNFVVMVDNFGVDQTEVFA